MTPTDRNLIQRLADALEGEIEDKIGWGEPDYDGELITEARTYLAQPEPEEPTDEELKEWYHQWQKSTNWWGHGDRPIHFARAVLARWGHQSIPPIPPCQGT